MRTLQHWLACGAALLLLSTLLSPLSTCAQGTAFTYQGIFQQNGAPYSGAVEMQFTVWDAASNGVVLAATTPATLPVNATNGLFTVPLDFGAAVLNGAPRWLQIDARTALGAFSTLTPRQALTATPYAIRALTASNLTGNLPVGQLTGTLPLAQLPAGVVTNNASGLSLTGTFTGNGAGLSNLNSASLGGIAASNHWRLTGNNVASNQFLGSTNNRDLELRVNNETAMRLSYRSNAAYGVSPAVIGGFKGNSASLNLFGNIDYVGATIGGGGTSNAANFVFADLGTVSGGAGNIASGIGAVIGGGSNNIASGNWSVAMGLSSSATGIVSTAMGSSFAGGRYATALGDSVANGESSTALGHATASGDFSTAMGEFSTASGTNSTAMSHSTASGFGATALPYSLASGEISIAMGTGTASGYHAIAMGKSAGASGDYSVAIGTLAYATNIGSFVWADSYQGTVLSSFHSKADNTFNIRARGGVWLDDAATAGVPTDLYFGANARQMINLFNQQYGIGVQSSTTYFRSNSRFSWFRLGSHSDTQNDPGAGGTVLMTLNNAGLTVNGTFVSASDRNKKENFAPVNPADVLAKVVALPISQWNYKDDEERSAHVGPMAQDFKAAFNLGADDKHIATVDADGVALAAIQGLNQKLDSSHRESHARIQKLEAENSELRQELRSLRNLLEKIPRTAPVNP